MRKLLKVPEPWKNLSKAGFGENSVAMTCKVNHREEMGHMGRVTQQLIDEGSHRDETRTMEAGARGANPQDLATARM